MTERKIKILVAGLFVLCLLSLFWKDHRENVIGLTELVAASGAWACAVWLWKDEWWNLVKRGGSSILAFVLAGVRILSVLLLIAGTIVILYALIFSDSIGKAEAGKMLFLGFGLQAAGGLPFYVLLWIRNSRPGSHLVSESKKQGTEKPDPGPTC